MAPDVLLLHGLKNKNKTMCTHKTLQDLIMMLRALKIAGKIQVLLRYKTNPWGNTVVLQITDHKQKLVIKKNNT